MISAKHVISTSPRYRAALAACLLVMGCVGPRTSAVAEQTTATAVAPPPADAKPAAADAKPAAAENYFDVHEYRVLGNTVLTNREIETTLYPLLGDHKTLTDVEVARAALEKTYHDRGFATVFVDIPEQDVTDRIVRLKVTEGRLHEVRITGARYFSERKILAAIPEATAGTVPNMPQLQSQLSAVSIQSADRAVVPVLKAGPTPGTVDLFLNVNDHLPIHGSLELDNQNTPNTKPLRSTVSLSYNNLFQDLDSLSVQFQAAPQDVAQVNVIAANYAWGPWESGLRPSVYFVNSNSDVPTVGTFGVLGKGQIFGTRLAYFLNNSPLNPQSFTLGIDYKHFLQSIALPSSPGINTPITYTNISFAYNGGWTSNWLSASAGSSANFGPRGVPNGTVAFADKRFKAYPNYFYLKANGNLTFTLPEAFQIVLRADGQFAAEPLITNEEFATTGADGVRGYLEAEVLSDIGYKGTVQFQSPMWRVQSLTLGDLFLFYDAGHAGIIHPLSGEPDETALRSWGLGFNLLPSYWINGSLTWADPLLDGPNTHRGASRVLFVVRGSF